MSLIEWNDALYSVKIDQFDEDHKKLLSFINDLHEAMRRGEGKSKLSQIFNDLRSYTQYHFKAEEKQMAMAGYPGLEAHKKLHKDLTDQLGALTQDLHSGKKEISIETFRFLKDWLFNHIQVADKKYVPWLTQK